MCKLWGMNASPDIALRLREIGVNRSYAWQIANDKRAPSQKLAVRIFRETGLKLGPVADLSDPEIAVLEKMHG